MSTRASVLSLQRQGGDSDFMCLLKKAFDTRSAEPAPGDTALRIAKDVTPINRRGGHEPVIFDLGDARFTSPGYIEYPASGQRLIYSIQGSAPGGVLDFDFGAGGTELNCIPGSKLSGAFDRFVVRRNAASMQSGAVMLRVQNEPDADYTELTRGYPGGLLGNPSGGGIGPAGATTQAYNSAAGNIPTAAADGLSLAGVSGVRAMVKSSNGAITAAQLVWWQFSTADNAWAPTDMLDVWALAGASATALWCPLDKQVWVPEGRIYPELRSATNAGGSGAFTVRLATWGQ